MSNDNQQDAQSQEKALAEAIDAVIKERLERSKRLAHELTKN